MGQEWNAMSSLRIDFIRLVFDSSLYLIFVSEHCGSAGFKRRSLFQQVSRDRNAAHLGCALDRGLMISLAPSIWRVKQPGVFFQHFSNLLQITVSCDHELAD